MITEGHTAPAPDKPSRGWLTVWLIAASLLPVIVWFIRRLDDGSDEPLGLAALGLALLLAWRDRRSIRPTPLSRGGGALLLLASALATPWLPPLLRAATAVAGVALFYGMHRRPGITALLMLSLPVIASLQFWAGYPLRALSAAGVVEILHLSGVTASRAGTGILTDGQTINVDPACSGIRMLWHILAAGAALSAFHRLSIDRSIALLAMAAMLAIPANMLRALLLVAETCGKLPSAGIFHEGAGLLCTSMVLGVMWWFAARSRGAVSSSAPVLPIHRHDVVVLVFAAMAGPWLSILSHRDISPAPLSSPPAVFSFAGVTLPLQPLPATPVEEAFANGFPGTLGSFTWSDRQVILRRVTKATRRLHPSRDCLRAAGFLTTDAIVEEHGDGSRWSRFNASRPGQDLTIRERIVSEANGQTWTDVSPWFWSALFHPLNSPWRAETVIEDR
ncbi:archaeosortase/exosortase family protein [Luteolibacter ambystomatis]|uniref:Archaeosortase/exosortase family protein n=1 Tax=Luteolibacter ambystomatis TaxID=2824561 RepID=A0A975IZ87_9BACT|nr:exosortase/archaeosortase family protein [Luteolibacter ambystomatis]QUE50924.1 archaeosortase/exosortase family protein [Luteolibacter ambystomatis]